MKRAFTLIELLIVVAIIAILAAIAVPNFLEAQTRAKVTRAKNDMRTIATALEAYMVDFNKYPYDGYFISAQSSDPMAKGLGYWTLPWHLSTPIAYVTSTDSFIDLFRKGSSSATTVLTNALRYINTSSSWDTAYTAWSGRTSTSSYYPAVSAEWGAWYLDSAGPDKTFGPYGWDGGPGAKLGYPATAIPLPYDATNGTVSNGDIIRAGRSGNYPN